MLLESCSSSLACQVNCVRLKSESSILMPRVGNVLSKHNLVGSYGFDRVEQSWYDGREEELRFSKHQLAIRSDLLHKEVH